MPRMSTPLRLTRRLAKRQLKWWTLVTMEHAATRNIEISNSPSGISRALLHHRRVQLAWRRRSRFSARATRSSLLDRAALHVRTDSPRRRCRPRQPLHWSRCAVPPARCNRRRRTSNGASASSCAASGRVDTRPGRKCRLRATSCRDAMSESRSGQTGLCLGCPRHAPARNRSSHGWRRPTRSSSFRACSHEGSERFRLLHRRCWRSRRHHRVRLRRPYRPPSQPRSYHRRLRHLRRISRSPQP